MGDNSIQDVIGKGNIRFLVGDKWPIETVFTNVLHIPGLLNFFLMTKVTLLAHVIEFKEKKYIIKNN
jgi:hypothetical protein